MGSFLNSKPRRRVYEEVIQQQMRLRMILRKYYWDFLCLGTNCHLYFNDMHLSTIPNGMLVSRYGTLLNQPSHDILATSHGISTSFKNQEKILELMLLYIGLWILSTTLLMTHIQIPSIVKTQPIFSIRNSALRL